MSESPNVSSGKPSEFKKDMQCKMESQRAHPYSEKQIHSSVNSQCVLGSGDAEKA